MNSESSTIYHVEIIVKGLVQGVSFRAYSKRKALSLGLTGFVRNQPDGSVFLSVEGKKKDIFQMINWLRKKGSPASNVTDVHVKWIEKLEKYNSFRIAF